MNWIIVGIVSLSLAACSGSDVRKMQLLNADDLEAAQKRWEAHGSDSYHFVVKVKSWRTNDAIYDIVVRNGKIDSIKHNGQPVTPGATSIEYTVTGLFRLLREEMRMKQPNPDGSRSPLTYADMFARFDPETGRLDRYKRTTVDNKQFRIEVLEYEPEVHATSSGM